MGTKLVERGITRYDIEEQGTYGFMVRISREGNHINAVSYTHLTLPTILLV